jgi:hypothetical protein
MAHGSELVIVLRGPDPERYEKLVLRVPEGCADGAAEIVVWLRSPRGSKGDVRRLMFGMSQMRSASDPKTLRILADRTLNVGESIEISCYRP